MSVQHETTRYDTPALLSPLAAVASFALLGLPALSALLSAAAILFALASRRRLRNDGGLRGARAGLAGLILGCVAFGLVAIPFAISLVLHFVGALT